MTHVTRGIHNGTAAAVGGGRVGGGLDCRADLDTSGSRNEPISVQMIRQTGSREV